MSKVYEINNQKQIDGNKSYKKQLFKVRYSPNGKLFVTADSMGYLNMYQGYKLPNPVEKENQFMGDFRVHRYDLGTSIGQTGQPILSIGFRPNALSFGGKDKYLAVCSCGFQGDLVHVNLEKGAVVNSVKEEGNEIYAVEYRGDGKCYASAGKDRCVRIYDESNRKLSVTLKGANDNVSRGHVNRVFSVRFHPLDPNVLYTGGWDCSIQVFDKRTQGSVRSIGGPYIVGDGIDLDKNDLLVSSYRTKDKLQIFDFLSGKVKETFDFDDEVQGDGKPKLMPYCCAYNHGKDLIAVGGGGSRGVKIFDRKTKKQVFSKTGFTGGIFSLAWNPHDDSELAFGGASGSVYVAEKRFHVDQTLQSQSDPISESLKMTDEMEENFTY